MMAGLLATIGDPSSTRLVYALVIALGVIGVALLVLGVYLFRSTKVDPEMLAPLERMGERSWRKQDPASQQRLLDEVRPEGATPLWRAEPEPERDEEFDEKPAAEGFDDLRDDAVDAERKEPSDADDVSESAESDEDPAVAEVDQDVEQDADQDAGAADADAVASEPDTGDDGAADDSAEQAAAEATEAAAEPPEPDAELAPPADTGAEAPDSELAPPADAQPAAPADAELAPPDDVETDAQTDVGDGDEPVGVPG